MALIYSTEPSKEKHSFIYGDEAVPYKIIRKIFPEGKKRKITIKINPSCEAVITAPEDAANADIHQAIVRRAKWVWDALQEFRTHQEYVQTKQYVSGEMLFYLGRRYVLKVVPDNAALPTVKISRGNKLLVTLTQFNADKTTKVKALVRNWYEARSEHIFHERLSHLLPQTTWVKGIPRFRIMPMQQQWGSCSEKGNLTLNFHLVKAPQECINYVILHELCHIAEHNHSERFWRLLTQVMPNWKAAKNQLDGMAELYLYE